MSVPIVKYLIANVKPGMKLGTTIISEHGRVILSEHAILTDTMIFRLEEWGYTEVFIEETNVPDYIDSAKQRRQYYIAEHTKIVHALSDAFYKARYFKKVPYQQMYELAEQTMHSLLDMNVVISYLHMVNSTDDYTFRHSVNVGVIAGIIGKRLKLSEPQLVELVLCGLMHDIGKTRIPLEILNKPTKLLPSELKIMQEHSVFGYELIAGSRDISNNVKLGVLQHHERLDGSGYPDKLQGSGISQLARIIAVADVYDAMTSTRIYRKALTPFVVMEELLKEMFGKLDVEVCLIFLNRVRETLLGSLVRLSNGSIAKIVYVNHEQLNRPVVQTTEGLYIELAKQRSIDIIDFIA